LKGGFSFRAKREFAWSGEIWATGFSDHRIRNEQDYETHIAYMAQNPVREHLVEDAKQFPYGSASGLFELDKFPQGLKPDHLL
jgi:putative transposase